MDKIISASIVNEFRESSNRIIFYPTASLKENNFILLVFYCLQDRKEFFVNTQFMPTKESHYFLFILKDQLKRLYKGTETVDNNGLENLESILSENKKFGSWKNFIATFGRKQTDSGIIKAPIRLVTINKLFLSFTIERELFLLSPEEERKFFVDFPKANPKLYFTNEKWKEIITKPESKHTESLIFASLPLSNDLTNNLHYSSEYLKIVAPYFKDVRHSLRIYEPLFKGDNSNPEIHMTQYRVAHETIYELIYSKLKETNNNFNYARTFAVDFSDNLIHKDTKENIQIALMLEISTQSFIHIINCINSHYDNVSFYVRKFERFRQFGLFDGKFIIFEDYIKNGNVYIPETLSIFSIATDSKITDQVNKTYAKVFHDSESHVIDFKNIALILKKTKDFITRQIEHIQGFIETISQLEESLEMGYFSSESNNFRKIMLSFANQRRKIDGMIFVYEQVKLSKQ